MTDELKEVDYYLNQKWTTVEWDCPYCGETNEDDYDLFDEDEIWQGNPSTECCECGREVRLGDKDYG